MTTSPPHAGEHPPLEALAAFAEGRLTGAERRRMIEHVDACEVCHEVLVDTLHLQAEAEAGGETSALSVADGEDEEPSSAGATVLRPHPSRWRRALPLAAALAVAALAGLLLWTPLGRVFLGGGTTVAAVGDVTAQLSGHPAVGSALAATWESHGWQVRGGPTTPEALRERSFRLGVRAAELHVALAGGEGGIALYLTHRLEALLEDSLLAGPVRALYAGREGVRGRLEAGDDPAGLLPLAAEADRRMRSEAGADRPDFGVDPLWYSLGKWAAAGQLAATAGRVEWFSERAPARLLRGFREADLPAEVASELERVAMLTGDGIEPAELPELRDALSALIRAAGD